MELNIAMTRTWNKRRRKQPQMPDFTEESKLLSEEISHFDGTLNNPPMMVGLC